MSNEIKSHIEMTDEKIMMQMNERYGVEHFIQKKIMPKNGRVDLGKLNNNQSVCFGDGKTYYFLLTKKQSL